MPQFFKRLSLCQDNPAERWKASPQLTGKALRQNPQPPNSRLSRAAATPNGQEHPSRLTRVIDQHAPTLLIVQWKVSWRSDALFFKREK
jgi:hypothetical protein